MQHPNQRANSSSFDQISRVISFTELTIETETGGERRLLRISSIFHGPGKVVEALGVSELEMKVLLP